MKKTILAAAAICSLGMAATAYAQDNSIGVKVSTLGVGIEAEHRLSDKFAARAVVNYFPYDYSSTRDGIEYDFDLKLLTIGALVDWHPFSGTFRLSGGVLINENELSGNAKTANTYDIGDHTYTGAQLGTLEGDIEFNTLAPYLGIGWDTSFGKDKKFGFICDLGVIYQGSPDVSLSANGAIASDPTFQSDLAKERSNLEDDLDNYQFYPVIALGLIYRF